MSTSEREKEAVTDLLSLLGLSLNGLIIEKQAPKLLLKSSSNHAQAQATSLILNIKAPSSLVNDDLLHNTG